MFANRSYRKSNRTKKVHFKISELAYGISAEILQSSEVDHRQRLSTELLDELCDLARIDIVNVEISSAKQHHRRSKGRVSMRQYGYYKPDVRYIYITNHTAVRGQPLAAKTFLNTLLHEWMHHYDTHKLKINSMHTKGFYLRLGQLEKNLR
ncbi:hypothetical protein HN358_01425 [Candidatus Uhrbacteria bacterium]|jgi:hypothetical protein|nr:hypothetical protein [Candidatus Uhrbacteria bacterium]MBT7717309.1 hypothetical protein [Candidatus Uhrbacteria bacterium]